MPRGRPKKSGPREPNGQPQRASKSQEKAVQQTLITRAVHCGFIEMRPIPTKAAEARGLKTAAAVLDAMKAPWMGCHAGRSIHGEEDVADLWDTIQTVRAKRRTWLRSIDAPDDFPKAASMPVAEPELQQGVEVDRQYDDRTEVEKADDAERTWNNTAAMMAAINPMLLRVICLDRHVEGPVALWVRRLRKVMNEGRK